MKKHGTGKGLITKDTLVKKYGRGKGLMTEKSASLRSHGMGKGLMTVWRATNPHAGDIPTGVGFGESAKERKKKLLQRQSILVEPLAMPLIFTLQFAVHAYVPSSLSDSL